MSATLAVTVLALAGAYRLTQLFDVPALLRSHSHLAAIGGLGTLLGLASCSVNIAYLHGAFKEHDTIVNHGRLRGPAGDAVLSLAVLSLFFNALKAFSMPAIHDMLRQPLALL